jgi:signal transduction histidine kinase
MLFGEPGPWDERLPLAALTVLGVLAAAVVGALAAANPDALPAGWAGDFRVALILVLLLAGVFARTARLHARMGTALLAAVPLISLWLLNGSKLALPFTIGLLFSSLAPAVVCYLLLAHPTGRLRSSSERRLLGWCGGAMVGAWTLLVLTHAQPPFDTPLLRCAPHCPRNLAYVGSSMPAGSAVRIVAQAAWALLSLGTLMLLVRRLAHATPPVRRVIGPTVVVAAVGAVFVSCFFVARTAGWHSDIAFASAYIAAGAATPLAIGLGLLLERLFMGRALPDLLERLAASEGADVQELMAQALHDPTLTVAYRTGTPGEFVDATGAAVAVPPADEGRAAVVIESGGAQAGAVLFDSQLAEQERYVQAAGEAALMWLQNRRLESDREISRFELAVSRRRVQEAAVEERRRIQRDLHDGAQQRLLAMRAQVTLLLDGREGERERRRALSGIQRELTETLAEVRTLAEGVYPPLLVEYGLGPALRGVSRRMTGAVTINGDDVGRFPTAVEGAVYFTCLEALQNVAKHAGADARARVQLWREDGELRFEVVDDGRGFSLVRSRESDGLVNMRDRITALGGAVRVHSAIGIGTSVRGGVPVLAEHADGPPAAPGAAPEGAAVVGFDA